MASEGTDESDEWQGFRSDMMGLLVKEGCTGKMTEFQWSDSNFNGIVAHLTEQCGGNIADEGVVSVTSKSTYDGVSCIVDFEDATSSYTSRWQPVLKCEQNEWFCLDFGDDKVTVTHYTIRTAGRNHIKSWIVEGSNDRVNWTGIGAEMNNDDLNEQYKIQAFPVACEYDSRFVRVRQVDKNHYGNYTLTCSGFELFGSLRTGSTVMKIPFGEKLLSGIVAHITEKVGGNVHEAGVVDITASTGCEARSVLDLCDIESFYASVGEPDQWICIDFKTRRVIPKNYSIRSRSNGWRSLKSWVVEGSLDGVNWIELDRRENNTALKGMKEAVFSIYRYDYFRFMRLRQIGNNHDDMTGFCVSAIEIFGTLIA